MFLLILEHKQYGKEKGYREKQMKLNVIRMKEILKNREEINKRDYFYYTENKGKWMNEIKTWGSG